MKTFAILTSTSEGADQYDITEFLGVVHDEAIASALMQKIRRAAAKNLTAQIRVAALDMATYGWRVTRTGGGAQPLALGMIFDTAMAASRHMGYTNNQVANRLGKARRAGKSAVTICGVTLELAPQSTPAHTGGE